MSISFLNRHVTNPKLEKGIFPIYHILIVVSYASFASHCHYANVNNKIWFCHSKM